MFLMGIRTHWFDHILIMLAPSLARVVPASLWLWGLCSCLSYLYPSSPPDVPGFFYYTHCLSSTPSCLQRCHLTPEERSGKATVLRVKQIRVPVPDTHYHTHHIFLCSDSLSSGGKL